MQHYEQKMKQYIQDHQIDAEHLVFEEPCHSVAEAAEAVGAEVDELVKNICMLTADGRLVVAIVPGAGRASTKRVVKALALDDLPRMTTPEEILDRTGYPCGGTPSFGFDAIFLVDPKVMEQSVVYTGGGSPNSLVRVNVKTMLEANSGTVVRVRK